MIRIAIATLIISLTGTVQASEEERAARYKKDYLRPSEIPYPEDNKPSTARELLGRTLFFDPILSRSGWISCASCHNPGLSWGDGLAKGLGDGMKPLKRRSQTLLDMAWNVSFFWDGRADTLEQQALLPIVSTAEMNIPLEEVVQRISAIEGYRRLFKAAYPGEPLDEKTLAKALAHFQRVATVSGIAPFDRWVKGDKQAISPAAKRGFVLFNEKAACSKCHSGWRFTDESFHDIGVPGDDRGRGELFPDIDVNQFAFKTPTLRNVAHRSPFMHDGSEATLEQVIDLYDKGGREKRPSLSPLIQPLQLTAEEKQDLIEFMKTLTGPVKPIEIPYLPR